MLIFGGGSLSSAHELETRDERLSRGLGHALLWGGIVAPVAWAMGYSLLYSLGAIGLLNRGWTLRHWDAALTTGGLRESAALSLSVAGLVTALASSGALAITLAFAGSRSARPLLSLMCIPLAAPAAVTALMGYEMLNPGGLLSRMAFHGGWIRSPANFPALVNDPLAIGIIILQAAASFPLLTLFFAGAWQTAGVERYCRVAESLGATHWQARRQIALPMLVRRGAPAITLVFLWQLGSYEIPLLLGRQAPQMFSVLIQRHSGQFDLEQRPQAFALAVTYLLLAGSILATLLKMRRRRAEKQ
jgi:putative spermidine/putrescine transport system permease protein